MLYNMKVSNYCSVNEPIELDLEWNNSINEDNSERYHNYNNTCINKITSLYGENGSGKTTILSVLDNMQDMVLNSSKNSQEGELLPLDSYAFSSSSSEMPTFMEVTFLYDFNLYRYGLEASRTKIYKEYLYAKLYKDNKLSSRESKLFVRNLDEIEYGSTYKSIKKLVNASNVKLRDNSLFLSLSAQLGHTTSANVVEWFNNIRVLYGGGQLNNTYTASILEDEDHPLHDKVKNLLKKAQIGFDDAKSSRVTKDIDELLDGQPTEVKDFIKTQDIIPKEIIAHDIKTFHEVDGTIYTLDLEDESEGAKKFFSLAGPIVDCLEEGYILVIDELETKLHCDIVRNIIEEFSSTNNNNFSQLIYTTHSPLLMSKEYINRDQMWIISNLNSKGTKINRITDKMFKIRKDTVITNKILSGSLHEAIRQKYGK